MSAVAVPIGAVSACVAWALLKVIGLITNLVFYQQVSTVLRVRLVAPQWTRRSA